MHIRCHRWHEADGHFPETIRNVFAVISCLVFYLSYLSRVNNHVFGLEQGTTCILVAMDCLRKQRVCVERMFCGHLRLVSGPRDASTQPPGIGIW